MMNDIAPFTLFSLIFMRMSGFVLLNPVTGRRNLPAAVQGAVIFVLTTAVYSFHIQESPAETLPVMMLFLYLKEFAVGAVIGFVMDLFLFVVNYSGYVIDFQMGLSMAAVYDPQSNTQTALSGKAFQIYFMLMFFAVDGHLALMKIILTSSDAVPYGAVSFSERLPQAVLDIFVECIVMAVKFSMPFIVILFLVEIGVGILMKIVPQINIFVVNIQMKVFFGIVLLLLLFSPAGEFLNGTIDKMITTAGDLLRFL